MAQNTSHIFGSLYLFDAFPPEQVSRVILNLDLSEGACHSLSGTEIVVVRFGRTLRLRKGAPLFVYSIRRVPGAAKVGRTETW